MLITQLRSFIVAFWLLMILFTVPAFARGDKVIPQVADGPGIITRFDFSNISATKSITNCTLQFYHQDGTKWSIQTTLDPSARNEFPINLNPHQTLHVETLGKSSSTDSPGYAIVTDDEPLNSDYSKDYALGITTYYVVYSGSSISGIVSVPVGDPTVAFSLPVSMNIDKNTYTGWAIVNLSGASTLVTLNFYPAADSPTQTPPPLSPITLKPYEQQAKFFNQYYPDPQTTTMLHFKGLLEGTVTSGGPVAILGLTQIATATGPQYASITPTLRDYLRQDTDMLLLQAQVTDNPNYRPLDLDAVRSDYFINGAGDEGMPWDIKYETLSGSSRQLTPLNGAAMASLGVLSNDQFDAYSLPDLGNLQYRTDSIDLSDGSPNLKWGYAFAVRTGLGNYVKVHIIRTIATTYPGDSNVYQDLGFEVYIYK